MRPRVAEGTLRTFLYYRHL